MKRKTAYHYIISNAFISRSFIKILLPDLSTQFLNFTQYFTIFIKGLLRCFVREVLPNIFYAHMFNASVFTLGLLFGRGFFVVDGLGRDREGIAEPYVHFYSITHAVLNLAPNSRELAC